MKGTMVREDETINPVHGSLATLPAVTMNVVSGTELERLWDRLVRQYHYLSYQKLLGHRLKYLAFIGDTPVAALSFSAPALKLAARDCYIGWSPLERKAHLNRIVNNSRFLVLPSVVIPHLASSVLARALRRLPRDWEEHFGIRPWLVETFVDPSRFKGTCYRAANFIRLGPTFGSGKMKKGYVYHGVTKEVYLYVLDRSFRSRIGCVQKVRLFHRPSPLLSVEALAMILRHAGWHPLAMPSVELTESDVERIAKELVGFHEQFHGVFGRKEQHRLGLAYLTGLLSSKEAKSAEPIALSFLDEHGVRPLQQFLKTQKWDDEAMLGTHQVLLSKTISSPEAMITVDSSEFPKKGKESVGVARQYCGALGKVDNCQSGVFLGYSSEAGYGLLAARLYLPETWFTDEYEERRRFNLVPEDCTFQTKPEIAAGLIKDLDKNLFPATWIGCDASFSDWQFLESLPKETSYFAAIKANTQVFLRRPTMKVPPYHKRGRPPQKARRVRGRAYNVSDLVSRCSFSRVVLAEGAKGPLMADVAAMRVYPSHHGMPKAKVWLFVRRTMDGQIKYAFSNAPEDIELSELAKASVMRWPIEQCFQDGKSQVGMDQYEHRSWPAWHRHMLYVFLALHFLLRLRVHFKKNSCPDSTAGTDAGGSSAPP
jgi:SRSO17 transposase